MFIAQSFAKNLGLYGDRIGALHIVTPNKDAAWKAYTKIR
jgi:aspartate aminotransferase